MYVYMYIFSYFCYSLETDICLRAFTFSDSSPSRYLRNTCNVLVWTREEFYIALDDAHDHNGAAEFHLAARQHSACSGLFSRGPSGPGESPTSFTETVGPRSRRACETRGSDENERVWNRGEEFSSTSRRVPRDELWRFGERQEDTQRGILTKREEHAGTRRVLLRPRTDFDWSANTRCFAAEPPANAGEGRTIAIQARIFKAGAWLRETVTKALDLTE